VTFSSAIRLDAIVYHASKKKKKKLQATADLYSSRQIIILLKLNAIMSSNVNKCIIRISFGFETGEQLHVFSGKAGSVMVNYIWLLVCGKPELPKIA
jgi:hypothetical protein